MVSRKASIRGSLWRGPSYGHGIAQRHTRPSHRPNKSTSATIGRLTPSRGTAAAMSIDSTFRRALLRNTSASSSDIPEIGSTVAYWRWTARRGKNAEATNWPDCCAEIQMGSPCGSKQAPTPPGSHHTDLELREASIAGTLTTSARASSVGNTSSSTTARQHNRHTRPSRANRSIPTATADGGVPCECTFTDI